MNGNKDYTEDFKKAFKGCLGDGALAVKKIGLKYVAQVSSGSAFGARSSLLNRIQSITGIKWTQKIFPRKSQSDKFEKFVYTPVASEKVNESSERDGDFTPEFVKALKKIGNESLVVRKTGINRYEVADNDRYGDHFYKWHTGEESDAKLVAETGKELKDAIEELTGKTWTVISITGSKGKVERFIFKSNLAINESRATSLDTMNKQLGRFIERKYNIKGAYLELDEENGYNLVLPENEKISEKNARPLIKFIKDLTRQDEPPELYVDRKTGAIYVDGIEIERD